MFYVERDIIIDQFAGLNIKIGEEKTDKMYHFAEMIHEANSKFNITGLKSADEIFNELIIGSIMPVCDIIVPRGTRFIDLGSGAGIPGITLAVYFDGISGVLIEANNRKAKFIESVISGLKLKGLQVICGRAEEIAVDPVHRERYDWCFIRALGKLYIMLELGAPFVRKNGHLYIYSNVRLEDISEKELKHIEKLGLHIMSHEIQGEKHMPNSGLCFKKDISTPGKYPRKYAIIKREAAIIND